MTRFRVIDVDEAKAYDPNEEWVYNNGYDERYYLLDTKKKEIVWSDGGEPEDQTINRDLGGFVILLNEIAAENG